MRCKWIRINVQVQAYLPDDGHRITAQVFISNGEAVRIVVPGLKYLSMALCQNMALAFNCEAGSPSVRNQ